MIGMLFVLCWILSGCGKNADQLVLAKVGDDEITTSQLQDFERRLPGDLQTRKTGFEGHLDYLQSLIDKEMLIQEARKRNLEEDPELRKKLAREKEELILRTYLNRELADEAAADDQELQRYFVETGRDREVEVRKIIVKTKGEAEEIVRLLKSGSDFAQLARDRSIHKATALRGGEIKGYARKGDMIPLFQEKVFPLHKGEMTEPVELPDGHYAIFQVTDERKVDLQAVRGVLEPELTKEKYSAKVKELIEKLQKGLGLHSHYQGLRFLAERARRGGVDFSEAERDTILYEFTGGRITLGSVVDLARSLQMNLAADEQGQILRFAAEVVMPRALLLEAARRAAIDEEEGITEWLKYREQALLLLAIRREVVSGVSVDEDEARQYYDRHPEVFTPLETMSLQEILVKTEEEAAFLKDRIERGADMGELAERHTLRTAGRGDRGKFHIHPFERSKHRELIEAAQGAKISQLVGPVEVAVPSSDVLDPASIQPVGKYNSIFRLLDSTLGQGPESFPRVEKRARALVRLEKQDRVFNQFLMDLRRQYEPVIEIYRDNLKTLSQQESTG